MLQDAQLEKADFREADLEGARFEGASLTGARFERAMNVPDELRRLLDDEECVPATAGVDAAASEER